MARNTRTWTATTGRDTGKRFLLTEMYSEQAEKWAIRAILALFNANSEVPDGALNTGMAGLASIMAQGVRSLKGMQYGAIAPLLDEMMACVKYIPQPPAPQEPQELWTGENCQIEEIQTRFQLRMEVLELHLGFSLAAVLSSTREGTSASPENKS
jgi:hypothetical protein